MRKLVLDIQDLNFSADFLGASPLAFGAWVRLSMYCATHMTGGTLEGCKSWDTFKWNRACGLDWASVAACVEAKLAEWDGMDLDVVGYSLKQERAYRSKSKGASEARSQRLLKSLKDKDHSDIRVDIISDITSLPFSSSSLSKRESAEREIGPTSAEHDGLAAPYPPGDKRIYPKEQTARVGLVEWIVHHPRCILGKDRDLWQGLFDYAGHEMMSHAYDHIPGADKLWFSTFNDYIHANYEEDKNVHQA